MFEPLIRPRRQGVVVIGSVLRVCAVVCSAALASACSSEPSAKDIRAAMEQQAEAANQQVGQMLGGSMKVEYHDVEKLGCEPTGQDNAYLCDVKVDVTAPVVGRQQQSGRVRMVKGDDGWIAMQQ
jgi:hypothetical protein